MSYSACHTSLTVVFLAFLVRFRFIAQNLRFLTIFEFSEFIPATACVYFILSCSVFDVTTHCHQQCASSYFANSASPISSGAGWIFLSVSLSLSKSCDACV